MTLGVACYIPGEGFVGGEWGQQWKGVRCWRVGERRVIEAVDSLLSCTKHIWYSEHGMYCQFEIILERAMSATHIAVIPHMRTHSDEEEFLKK